MTAGKDIPSSEAPAGAGSAGAACPSPPETVTTALPSEDLNLELRRASDAGDLKRVTEIVKRGEIDINQQGPSTGSTALHFAARRGHWEVCQFLISKGADTRIEDKKGFTPAKLATDDSLKTILNIYYPLQQAINFARGTFHSPVNKFDPDGSKTSEHRERIRALSGIEQEECYSRLRTIRLIVQPKDAKETTKQLNCSHESIDALIRACTTLRTAIEHNYTGANCGELALSAALFLAVNKVPHQVSILSILDKTDPTLNHCVVLIGKPEDTTFPCEKLPKDMLVLDPYNSTMINKASDLLSDKSLTFSFVTIPDRSNRFKFELDQFTTPDPQILPDSYREALQREWRNQIEKIRELVPMLDRGHDRETEERHRVARGK